MQNKKNSRNNEMLTFRSHFNNLTVFYLLIYSFSSLFQFYFSSLFSLVFALSFKETLTLSAV